MAGRAQEAFEAINEAARRLTALREPVLVAQLLCRTMDLLFLLKDREAALAALDRVLAISAEAAPVTAGPLALAACRWVDHEIAYHRTECPPSRLAALELLCQTTPPHLVGELPGRLRILRCRVLGDPPAEVLIKELESAAARDPGARGSQHLLDAVHLASHTLGEKETETQRLARLAEDRFLREELDAGAPGHGRAGTLIDLAFLRLYQPAPSAQDGEAALLLAERALRIVPLDQMPLHLHHKTREARWAANVLLFGRRGGRTAQELAQRGRELWTEVKLIAGEAGWSQQRLKNQLGALCTTLRVCAVPDPAPLRALAVEVEKAHQMERRDELALLREHWPADKLDPLVKTLCPTGSTPA